jgi:hypothetical protein
MPAYMARALVDGVTQGLLSDAASAMLPLLMYIALFAKDKIIDCCLGLSSGLFSFICATSSEDWRNDIHCPYYLL